MQRLWWNGALQMLHLLIVKCINQRQMAATPTLSGVNVEALQKCN